MYIPRHFKGKDRDKAIQFMQRYNFAVMITSKDGTPIATHLPFIITKRKGQLILSSHFAKMNPQTNDLAEKRILIIFSQPHAYISPKHYENEQQVPTWNYVSVHAYGTAQIIDKDTSKIDLLEIMIDDLEPEYRKQWETLDETYKKGLVQEIVAFEITVNELQFKEKLSQNKRDIERKKISNSLNKSPHETERQLGEYMDQSLNEKQEKDAAD